MIYSIGKITIFKPKQQYFSCKWKNSIKSQFRLKKTGLLFLLMVSGVVNFGCWSYSFTGASVLQHLKSIAIPVVDDRSGAAEPGLREMLTDKLVQDFIDDNTLQVTEKNKADALLESTITSLRDAPNIVGAGEQVQTRRITISVQAVYKDLVQKKTIFQKSFSNYGDYASNGSIAERNTAIQEAIKNISEDILLDVVSGW